MNKILEETLDFYKMKEMDSFKNSLIISELNELAGSLSLSVNCFIGTPEKDLRHIYLACSVVDQNGNAVPADEENDFCDIGYSICIIEKDKKERIKFFSWEDVDFLESVQWAINQLRQKVHKKNG